MRLDAAFSRPCIIENDLDDFKMPYSIYGSQDYQNLLIRYRKLRNNSQGLHKRFNSRTRAMCK